MWLTLECDTDIQILPEGEETMHDWDGSCMCHTRVSLNDIGKLVICHRAFDRREIMEVAYESPLHKVRQKIDC